MKTIFPVLFSLFVLFIFSCNTKEVTHEPTDRLDAKHGPSEQFFLQRMDPSGNFSVKGYSKGLAEAQADAALLYRSADGFDNEWTVQGPGNIGGRINTIAVNPDNEDEIYTGFGRGGIFKTIDNGTNWFPILDDQKFNSIGDITLDPNQSSTVYVGTGDPNISGFPFIGDGLYRSEDSGETFINIGLEETRIISKVVVDPSDSDRIFAATMGLPFEKNNDRGLYRSEDRGATWDQVLFLSDSTGIADLIINPQNPQVMYAAGWDRIRNNVTSIVNGEGAKIFKTIDGGDTWNLVEGGLPNDVPNGRIGLAICESQPNVIYAQYANTSNRFEAIYRSDDAGENWYAIPTDPYDNFLGESPLGGFAWYFGKIRVSPTDPDDVYLLGVDLWRTRNAGQEWFLASPPWWQYSVHADKHDLVYLSDESVLLGTDGGMYLSDKDNNDWIDIENIPTNQFYRVAYNPFQPDLYYGGAQDNGSTGGNATTFNEWSRIYGGDGFQMAFDPNNENRFFVETQNGDINITLDGGQEFFGATDGIDNDDPRNWDMPYFISSYDSEKMVTGTDRLYVGRGEVPFWTPVSEVLTDGEVSSNRYPNITAIHESPIQEDLIFVGTGDGNAWVGNLNDFDSFSSISDQLIDQYITDIAGSDTDVNRVFVTHSGYRDNDNLARIQRSDDLGQNWVDISSNLPDVAINEILIMPASGDSIIFIGTDAGVYGTTDAGADWERLGTNMVILPIYDLVHNVAKNELVAATFGRSIQTYDLDPIYQPELIDVAVAPAISTSIEKLKVFPSLARQQITIEYSNIEPLRNSEIAIISSAGQVVKSLIDIDDRAVSKTIGIDNLPAGQYFVKVKVRHAVLSSTFIKQ